MSVFRIALGLAVLCVGWNVGCASGPAPGEGLAVLIERIDDTRVAAGAAHMDLGLIAEAILAEQISATKGFRLVLSAEELEKRRLAWERKAEDTSRPIEVTKGDPRAVIRGTVRLEGRQLLATATMVEGERRTSADVKGLLGPPERNKLLFRELALKLLAARMPDVATLRIRLGMTLKEEGLVVQALDAYRKAVEIDPTRASAHFNMGLAHDALGDIPSAIASYKKAVEADPTHAGAKYSWALDDLRERGADESRESFLKRVAGAVELFHQVLGVTPRSMEARFLLVEGLAILGRYSEALEECDRIRRIFPGEGRASEVKGNLLMRLKRYSEALVEFRKLEELDPSLITNAYFIAAALEKLGRGEEAAAKYLEFVERSGDDPKFEKARQNAKARIEALRPREGDGSDR